MGKRLIYAKYLKFLWKYIATEVGVIGSNLVQDLVSKGTEKIESYYSDTINIQSCR